MRWISVIMAVMIFTSVEAGDSIARIHVLARCGGNGIMLRWAPGTPVAWKYLNEYGYRIERITLLRDSQWIQPERHVLTLYPVKPLPLADWEKMADTSDYAAIAAQAIYGSSFDLATENPHDIVSVVNQATELENRYAFALYAVNQHTTIAKAAGLFYLDTIAKSNEHYLYKIISLVPDTLDRIDTGFYFIGMSECRPLPPPRLLSVVINDRVAEIKWDKIHFENVYIGYFIERSEDNGKSFRRVNSNPFINFSNQLNDNLYYIRFDSVPAAIAKVTYRIRGINAFGEVGPPSDTLSAYNRSVLKFRPSIIRGELLSNGSILVKWEFPEEGKDQIEGFLIKRSHAVDQTYQDLVKNMLSIHIDSFIDQNPLPSNYYKIIAVGKQGTYTESFPYLVQTEDSVPPAPPTGIYGKIDSSGRVTLWWRRNRESDLKGYLVYRANFIHEPFFQISKVCTDTFYYDTLSIKTLTRAVYYRIKAIDTHYNPSDYSDAVQLIKPDIVPPQPPVIRSYRVIPSGVYLQWIPSSSDDVVRHQLYRRTSGDTAWLLIHEVRGSDTLMTFTDTLTSKADYVSYTLIAIDSAGLESNPCRPLTVKVLPRRAVKPITRFYGNADKAMGMVTLTWRYDSDQVLRFVIYKNEKGHFPCAYRSVAGQIFTFTDSQLRQGITYEYRIKAIFTDGSETPLSEHIELGL